MSISNELNKQPSISEDGYLLWLDLTHETIWPIHHVVYNSGQNIWEKS